MAPEILFKPEIIGSSHESLVQTIVNTINKNDEIHREKFLENIVLTGGLITSEMYQTEIID